MIIEYGAHAPLRLKEIKQGNVAIDIFGRVLLVLVQGEHAMLKLDPRIIKCVDLRNGDFCRMDDEVSVTAVNARVITSPWEEEAHL